MFNKNTISEVEAKKLSPMFLEEIFLGKSNITLELNSKNTQFFFHSQPIMIDTKNLH